MGLKQCSGCQEMVDDSKAYCPDCGAPMDEEQRRSGSSEYDSMSKTQNLNMTSQLKILDQFNLSSVFTPEAVEPNVAKKEASPVKESNAANEPIPVRESHPVRETKTVQLQAIPDVDTNTRQPARQPAPVVLKPASESESLSSNSNAVTGNEPDSKKTLYIVGGIALLIIALALAAAVTFGLLNWFNAK